MDLDAHRLGLLYRQAHDRMRDVDGFLPQEALDELLKFLLYKEHAEAQAGDDSPSHSPGRDPARIREALPGALAARTPWAVQIWQNGHFAMSDRALLDLQQLFAPIRFHTVPLDVRSAALRTFLRSDARRALGIFLTPDSVVRSMVEIADPSPTDVVLDPACGSGTFLIETVRFLSQRSAPNGSRVTVHGVDKNPRMLLLAEHNLGVESRATFRSACADSLRDFHASRPSLLGLAPSSVDLILTNPPFGVTVSRGAHAFGLFGGNSTTSLPPDRLPSEIVFLHLCFRLLRPGGRLGIVLPQSVLTNERLSRQRREIDRLGYLTEILDLPSETFAATGANTKTVAAFFTKHLEDHTNGTVSVRVCHVTNVGFDATGRSRTGNQLPRVAALLATSITAPAPPVYLYPNVPSRNSLQSAPDFLSRRHGRPNGTTLRRFVAAMDLGRTPSRSAYTEAGTFILKVGNLTGRGIDWQPRARNFVSAGEGARRAATGRLTLQQGDLLLTSSAHAAQYIAKKVDVIARVPSVYRGSGITFAGELIRIRPKNLDPYLLLVALRHPDVRRELQGLVRGQTAHLHPADMLDVAMPFDLHVPPQDAVELAALFRREAELALELNGIAMEAARRYSDEPIAPRDDTPGPARSPDRSPAGGVAAADARPVQSLDPRA